MRLLIVFLFVSCLFSEVSPAGKVRSKFETLKCPITQKAEFFVEMSDKYDLDYRLLPAIAIIESSCGKNYIKSTNNFLGWGSGKIKFRSQEECIETVAKYISERYPKGTTAILKKFNPRPEYTTKVDKVMKSF